MIYWEKANKIFKYRKHLQEPHTGKAAMLKPFQVAAWWPAENKELKGEAKPSGG